MKKVLFLFVILNMVTQLSAQNVGIGAPVPSEKLDVNGNINMSGNLRVNNVAGQANQVLMTNGSGNTVWTDMCEFKNYKSYTNSGSFTVPAGVTKIWIETWGAGGGGAAGGGGGGGGYNSSLFKVSPLSPILTITIGVGGAGATTSTNNAGNGSGSYVFLGTSIYVQDFGGFGASGTFSSRGGDSNCSGDSLIGFFCFNGNGGSSSSETYSTRSTNGTTIQYITSVFFGNGGGTYKLGNGSGDGFYSYNTVTGADVKINEPAFSGVGKGGAGGVNIGGTSWGRAGGNGLVIIHW